MNGTLSSTFSRTGMQNEAVLPVPFLARARTWRPIRDWGIDCSWMGDGCSYPISKIPFSKSRLSPKCSNSIPFWFWTSSVLKRLSFSGLKHINYITLKKALPIVIINRNNSTGQARPSMRQLLTLRLKEQQQQVRQRLRFEDERLQAHRQHAVACDWK